MQFGFALSQYCGLQSLLLQRPVQGCVSLPRDHSTHRTITRGITCCTLPAWKSIGRADDAKSLTIASVGEWERLVHYAPLRNAEMRAIIVSDSLPLRPSFRREDCSRHFTVEVRILCVLAETSVLWIKLLPCYVSKTKLLHL